MVGKANDDFVLGKDMWADYPYMRRDQVELTPFRLKMLPAKIWSGVKGYWRNLGKEYEAEVQYRRVFALKWGYRPGYRPGGGAVVLVAVVVASVTALAVVLMTALAFGEPGALVDAIITMKEYKASIGH